MQSAAIFKGLRICCTVKRPLSKRQKIGFHDKLSLNAGQKYCRMLQGEHSVILSTSLSYQLSLRPLFCLFSSGHFTQVLLYLLWRTSLNPYPANIFCCEYASAYYVCCIYPNALKTILIIEANIMNHDQTAPTGAV